MPEAAHRDRDEPRRKGKDIEVEEDLSDESEARSELESEDSEAEKEREREKQAQKDREQRRDRRRDRERERDQREREEPIDKSPEAEREPHRDGSGERDGDRRRERQRERRDGAPRQRDNGADKPPPPKYSTTDRDSRDRADRGDRPERTDSKRDRDRDRDRPRDRDRDRDRDRPPPRDRDYDQQVPTKRMSITDRIKSTFGRKDSAAGASILSPLSPTDRDDVDGGGGGSVRKRANVDKVREYLDRCNSQHGSHCNGEYNQDIPTWRPELLIDVVERRLVTCKPSDRYIALSYVWGSDVQRSFKEMPLQLMRSNLDELMDRIPESNIPRTIGDAIWATRKLGIRHLWVDRLCIVQDDETIRETHISHMAYVFSNAYMTIVAGTGDVFAGLEVGGPSRRQSLKGGSINHSDMLLRSKWNTRGWTLQELLYSRRSVFFFPEGITWECHCDIWEGGTSAISKILRGGNSSRQQCSSKPSSSAFAFQHAPWPDMDEFARIASDYSARRVTFVDDTLKAFSGITQVLSKVYPGGFMYGMPLMFLDIALLWRPQASIRRRALSRPPFLPSWSWMGWWFDGVPVDLTLWRAAADYVEDTKMTKHGQPVRRFQSPVSFRIKPTITWRLTDRAVNVPVQNVGLQFRDLRSRRNNSSNALPPGWSRSGSRFIHDSDDLTTFRYPVPVEDPPEAGEHEAPAGEVANPGPLLSFTTTGGLFDVNFAEALAPPDSSTPPVAIGNILARNGKWIGEFRAHDAWLGIQSSNYGGDEKLEFIAISTAMERRGSLVFSPEQFEANVEADGIMDIVNVLWIERIGGVAYRRGMGHIVRRAWDAQAKEEVDIVLG